jgi:hypothetical protein
VCVCVCVAPDVARFVAMRRYEKMIVREIVSGIKLARCRWLRGGSRCVSARVCAVVIARVRGAVRSARWRCRAC